MERAPVTSTGGVGGQVAQWTGQAERDGFGGPAPESPERYVTRGQVGSSTLLSRGTKLVRADSIQVGLRDSFEATRWLAPRFRKEGAMGLESLDHTSAGAH